MAQKYGQETSHEERTNRRMQIVYAGKMRERQTFMQDLKEFRKKKDKKLMLTMIRAIGPTWYHALSVPQRKALDALEFSMHQDILEGRPVRTAQLMRELGLYPRPNQIDLMNCLYLAQTDPKVMLAELFAITYGHSIDGKRSSYNLNAKLMLTGILYLGMHNLIILLTERFSPDKEEKKKQIKPKPSPKPPLASPYLQKMNAVLYVPPTKKPPRPPPLPNLDSLNEPYEEEPPIIKPPPPPPPPPPPKKRLPRSYCDNLAGIMNVEPYSTITTLTMRTVTRTSHHRLKGSKLSVSEVKKTYGIGLTNRKKGSRKRKPVAPSTGQWNAQYMICGVSLVLGKRVYILGSVSTLPPTGDLIHGGYRYLNGGYINIHCGFRAHSPPPSPDPCDCFKQWQHQVMEYVERSKCYCEHHYDYGNEGTFPLDELQYFQKPTKHMPFKFNYETIYDMDPKRLHVEREFKRLWDTDSMLHVDDGTVKVDKDKKKKKKRSSTTCLGQNPKPEDYLKCALRLMRRSNVAARLPDIHLVPELKEWMRKRIYGSYNEAQKSEFLRKSSVFWQMLNTLAQKDYGHVSPPKDPTYSGHTNWANKHDLNKKFRTYKFKYRLALFRSLAQVNNLMWPTMYQAQFPDKKFREIYYSYLFGRVEDLQLMHPYSSRETQERKLNLTKKRYCCIPAGIEPED